MSGGGFCTDLLDLAIQKERAAREKTRMAMLIDLRRGLGSSPVALREAFVFGSVTRPFAFSAHSDIDVAVHALDPRDYFCLKSYLEGELVREVDLVEIESCRFAEKIRRTGLRWTPTGS